MSTYRYYKERLRGMEFPYAVLDMGLFQKNIRTNLERAGHKKVRLASKSLRCVEIMHRILAEHEQFQGLMTYHGAETLYLAEQGFDDLLLGYPVVSKSLIEALGKAVKKGKQICLMVDSLEHLAIIDEVGRKLHTPLPVCIDIDLSDNYPGLRFGVWRSSISSMPELEKFLDEIKKKDFIRLEGLMGYEAQIAGVGDDVIGAGVKNLVVRQLKNNSLKKLRKRRQLAVELIRSKGFELRFVNGGGTGSLESTREEPFVTEVTVGSGFYNAHLFDYYRNFDLQPALFYAIQIVRKPTKNIYTCHGGGFIASGAVESIKAPIVYLPKGGYLDKMEGAGEVQTPVRFNQLKDDLQIGDPIFMRHAKSGELCERFNQLILLEKDKISEVNTYRGLGCSFG